MPDYRIRSTSRDIMTNRPPPVLSLSLSIGAGRERGQTAGTWLIQSPGGTRAGIISPCSYGMHTRGGALVHHVVYSSRVVHSRKSWPARCRAVLYRMCLMRRAPQPPLNIRGNTAVSPCRNNGLASSIAPNDTAVSCRHTATATTTPTMSASGESRVVPSSCLP